MRKAVLRPIVIAISSCFAAAPAAANPTGAQVVSGTVSMQRPDARTLNVTNSHGSIINWQGFSIGAGEVTRFIQQSSSSAVLNRVVGADISQIHGQLLSNGRVFLINPAGIVIGGGAMVDTAGFVASTLNMLNADFLAGKLKFQSDGTSGSIVNQGLIKTSIGGNVILVAPNIENSGVIQADGGQIILAAGQKLTIGSLDYEGVQFELQAPTDSALNIGKLLADGGAVGVFAGSLRHSGDIRANALTRDEAGRIVLKAQGDAIVDGNATITATGTKGGNVQVLGNRVGLLDHTAINMSGESGGGAILVGGDYKGGNPLVLNASRTYVGADVSLKADATTSGNGGKVIVWADDITRVYGSLSARGGALSGDGGFVETSGKQWMDFGARVDTSAPRGAFGTLLLDPDFLEATDVGTPENYNPGVNNLFANNPSGTTRIRATGANSISESVGPTSNVILQANTDITFTSPIIMRNTNTTITAQAGRSILVNANITSNNSNITLTANDPAADSNNRDGGAAQLTMAPGTTINAGTGIVRLRMGTGPGGAPSGNITIGTLTGTSVSIDHTGPTAGGSIVRADSNSLINVANNGTVHIEIDAPAGGTGSSIGTSAAPIRIRATDATAGVAGTARLESHYHGGGDGIFFRIESNVQIGGADPAVFPAGSSVRGLQALNQTGAAAATSGPVELTATGTITQQTGGALCGGNSGGQTGGPICSGTAAGGPFATATNSITLRAEDMTLAAPINSASVILLPTASRAIDLGTATGTGSLFLSNAELSNVTTSALKIGESTAANAPGGADNTSSGNLVFSANISARPNATLEVRSGGTITSTQAAGTPDITANAQDSNVTLVATGSIGTGANRIKLDPGVPTAPSVRAHSQAGSVFMEQTAGDMDVIKYLYTSNAANPNFEFATTNGDVNFNNLAAIFTGNANVSLVAGGTNNDIFFSGTATSIGANQFTLSPNRQTQFVGGSQTFNAGNEVFTSRPIVFAGGSATFNAAVTGSTATGTLLVSDGTATFNGTVGSSFAGLMTVSNTGTLAGTDPINAAGGLTFTGGTISNTGGVTVPAGQTFNVSGATGTPVLRGIVNADAFNMTGGTFTINAGTLNLTGTGAKNISGGTLSVSGTLDPMASGSLLLASTSNDLNLANTGTLLSIETAGTLDIRSGNANILGTGGSPALVNNGTLSKSSTAGTTNIGTAANPLAFTNNNMLSAGVGTLQYASGGTNTFAAGTIFSGGGTHNLPTNATFSGNATINNLATVNFSTAGTKSITGGTLTNNGTLNWTGGAMDLSGTGAFTNANAWNIAAGAGNFTASGNQLITNSGTLTSDGSHEFGSGASTRFHNSGNVVVNSGTLSLLVQDTDAGGALGDTGSYTANAGTLRFRDSFRNFLAASSVTGAGNIQFDSFSGGVFTLSGTYNPTGTTFISGNTTVRVAGNNVTMPLLNMTGATLDVTGTLNFTTNGAKTITGGTLTNSGGLIHAQGGTTSVGNAFPTNSGTLRITSPATFSTTANLVNAAAGAIRGTGTLNLNGNTLTSNGSVLPGTSPGTLTINGNYVQNGSLVVDLGGTSQGSNYDLLRVTNGNVTLNPGSTLTVSFFGSFTGAEGNVYDIITTPQGTLTGNFTTFNFPTGATFQGQPNSTFYRLAQGSSTSSSSLTSNTPPESSNTVLADQEKQKEHVPKENVPEEREKEEERAQTAGRQTCS